MKREDPIESRFKREELKTVNGIIIEECHDIDNPLRYQRVFKFFGCNNPTEARHLKPSYCGACPYIYKLGMTRPGDFGCCVKNYIEDVRRQFEENKKP